jgi:hypothetical protein
MQSLGRHNGEPFGEVETHLSTKDRQGAGSRAVLLFGTVFKDIPHEVEVLSHNSALACKENKIR